MITIDDGDGMATGDVLIMLMITIHPAIRIDLVMIDRMIIDDMMIAHMIVGIPGGQFS